MILLTDAGREVLRLQDQLAEVGRKLLEADAKIKAFEADARSTAVPGLEAPQAYAQRMADLRRAKAAALAAWEALTTEEERVRGLEAERDDLISEAELAEAAGDKFGPSYWNRRDAAEIQKRIDESLRPKCPTCGAKRREPSRG